MENKQVLTKEELNQLKEVQEMYAKILSELGQIDIQINEFEKNIQHLDNQKKIVLTKYEDLRKTEKEVGQVLSSKYGDGTINPNTGEFTPN